MLTSFINTYHRSLCPRPSPIVQTYLRCWAPTPVVHKEHRDLLKLGQAVVADSYHHQLAGCDDEAQIQPHNRGLVGDPKSRSKDNDID